MWKTLFFFLNRDNSFTLEGLRNVKAALINIFIPTTRAYLSSFFWICSPELYCLNSISSRMPFSEKQKLSMNTLCTTCPRQMADSVSKELVKEVKH